MPRPRQGYKLSDGTPVPGVTTILNRFKDSGGLIYWAWSQGKAGLDFRETKQVAADAGTLAHAMVEATLRGEGPPAGLATAGEEVKTKALSGYRAWLTWRNQTRLEVLPWEQPLVCECYRYGGTPDALFKLEGAYALGDWKNANAIYVETLVQLAAYKHLLTHSDAPALTGGFHIGRFSKEHGDFTHHYFSDLADAWSLFVLLRQAYDLDKTLQQRVK